jgi:hypothetical protein
MMETENSNSFVKWGLIGLSLVALTLIVSAILVSCSPPKANPQAQIDAAVAATLASIPTSTPIPVPTAYPSPTPFTLDSTFCEYSFCVGHPLDLYLIDQGATRNPPIPSTYGYGIIFSYNQNLFIQMAWTLSGPSFDPQTTMRYILEENEQILSNMDTQLVGDLNVFYNPISTSASALPFGGIAAWQCGGRDFAWKAYTPQDGIAPGLLKQALEKFRCEQK